MNSQTFLKRHKNKLGPSLALAAAVVLALIFHDALYAWFTGKKEESKPAVATAGGVHAGHGDAASPAQGASAADPHGAGDRTANAHAGHAPLSDAGLEAVHFAMNGYEQIRAELARDSLEKIPDLARALHHALSDERLAGTAEIQPALSAAAALATEKDLAKARSLFGEVSRAFVTLAQRDPRVAEGWSVFECPMTSGYRRWIQPGGDMANPYMGPKMLKCGSAIDLSAEVGPATAAAAEGDPNAIAYYTCPMHPSVRQSGPGQCPICGMDLTPVTKGDLASGIVTVDEVRRQRIGVKIDEVRKAPLTLAIRAVGVVKYDETKLEDVSLKVGGWIRGLKVDATGQPVKKGDVLFHLYSPELFAAQQEYLVALRTRNGDTSDPLVRAARQRLRLWDIPQAQIEALATRGEATETLAIRSPATGYVIEKDVVEGAAVEPGKRLYRIAALDRVWVEAQIYESDLPNVKAGQPVEVTLPFVPGKKFEGRIAYVYPYLQGGTRTGQVRIELPNPGGELKPEMYADVSFEVKQGERLQIPASAVIYTGPRRLVFVDLGEGRLQPREVKLGQRSGESFEVVEGLKEGERVVTSGNFLIAAESRIRSAAGYWGGGHAPH
jgi:membrane fusion protein, copper/silver efflux system